MKTSKEYSAIYGSEVLFGPGAIFSNKTLSNILGFEKSVIIQIIHDELSEGKKYFEKTGNQWESEWKCLGCKKTISKHLKKLVDLGFLFKNSTNNKFERTVQYTLNYPVINETIKLNKSKAGAELVESNHD